MVRGVVAASLFALLLAPPIASVSVAQEKKATPEAAKAKQEPPKKSPSAPAGAGGALRRKSRLRKRRLPKPSRTELHSIS